VNVVPFRVLLFLLCNIGRTITAEFPRPQHRRGNAATCPSNGVMAQTMKTMPTTSITALVVVAAHALAGSALAQDGRGQPNPPAVPPSAVQCGPHSPTKVIPSGSTGENIEGPVCAEVSINALRYGAEFGRTFTYSSGPNLTTIFPSTFSPGGAPPPPPPPPHPRKE
jgi:hypothetical protein